ncbi:MAG: hypothetical protein EBR82_30270 [Caulobacteraceae bacterium]|nr:hypothetical protein [Caulobacteraceae bacterium]
MQLITITSVYVQINQYTKASRGENGMTNTTQSKFQQNYGQVLSMTKYKKQVTFGSPMPKCWPIEEIKNFNLWKDAARISMVNQKSSVCEDCTPEYQARMIDEGKCENPEVVFDVDEDGFIFGRLPRQRELNKKCNAKNVPLGQKSLTAEEQEEGENV